MPGVYAFAFEQLSVEKFLLRFSNIFECCEISFVIYPTLLHKDPYCNGQRWSGNALATSVKRKGVGWPVAGFFGGCWSIAAPALAVAV